MKKLIITLAVLVLLIGVGFLIWYHVIPVDVAFDRVLYSETGEEVLFSGEVKYYRSLFSNGDIKGDATFGDKLYTAKRAGTTPFGFQFVSSGEDTSDRLTVNFLEDDYNSEYFIIHSVLGEGRKYSFNKTEKLPEEEPEQTEEGYEVTARDLYGIFQLSMEERAKEFLSALCLGDKEVVDLYINGTIDNFDSLKIDARIKEQEIAEGGEHLSAVVELKVWESESSAFEVGESEYILRVAEQPEISTVIFFGDRDTLGKAEAMYSSSGDDKMDNAVSFSKTAMRIGVSEKISNTDEYEIYHLAQHTATPLTEDGYRIKKDVLEEYLLYRFGIDNIDSYPQIKKSIDQATQTVDGETLVNIGCGHGADISPKYLEECKKEGNRYYITYVFYSDFAYLSPCERVTYVFEENENSDISKFVSIESEKLTDEERAKFSA